MDEIRVSGSRALLPRWWRMHAVAGIDHVAVMQSVIDEAIWSPRYLFMVLMSAGIALLGLLLSSPAVVIGAMLISPLMGPIIGVGFALAVFDLEQLRRSATALALGALIAVVFTALIVLLSPIQTVTAEIAARTRPNLFDLLVALLSAMAGAYATIRSRSGTIVGVAIATALMPPLAVVGFGLATWNRAVFGGALLLFLTNLITIALTATGMARLYGFGSRLSPSQSRLQAALLVAVMIALAVPLGFALRQIGWESVAARQIRDAVLTPFPDSARASQVEIDFDARPIRVRAVVLTPQTVSDVDAGITATLERRLRRPLDLHVDQLRTDSGRRSVDSAELAAAQAQAPAARDEGEMLRDRLAAITGVPGDQVTLDEKQRRAVVRAPALPGATLATWRALEQRAGAGLAGWQARIMPPPLPLPEIRIAEGRPDDPAALALAGWAAARAGIPVVVDGGSQEEAQAVVDALSASGGVATIGSRRGGAVRPAWSVSAP